MLCTPHHHHSGYQIKKNEMEGGWGARSVYEGEERCEEDYGGET